jgi:23S rRNA (cytidine1920-2'-O)/16S rRNA (cytidine1409-2'-O)-methyltransferase
MPNPPSSERQRLDKLLVDLGLAGTRSKAEALIRAGEVLVSEQRVDKPGAMVAAGTPIRVITPSIDVSRGAAKLRGALKVFQLPIAGCICADLGASTGGFTQVLLEEGAAHVHAFDVGYGLLHERLRTDPRVTVHDRVNVRHLSGSEMEPAGIVVMDLSFIGLELVFPAVMRISTPEAECAALIKPQFEAGRGQVGKGGIVKDPKVLKSVLETHLVQLEQNGFSCWGLVPSDVKGKKGNQEFLSWFRKIEHYGKRDFVLPDLHHSI